MGRATVQLPRIAPASPAGPPHHAPPDQAAPRPAAAPAARQPAHIRHPTTVYQASPDPDPRIATMAGNVFENSGSLTGDVLSRGLSREQTTAPATPRSGLRILAIALLIITVVGLLALFGMVLGGVTIDAVSSFFDSVSGR